jgi:hypothetical protein
MEMDCLTFTEAEVVAGGTVALGFVDETGKSVKVRLSLNQVGRLAMTLPELVATALRNQHGNQKMLCVSADPKLYTMAPRYGSRKRSPPKEIG